MQPKTYTNDESFVPTAGFLSDGAMVEVLDNRPIVCVDVLLVDYATKELLLPTRTLASGRGLWFIGGMLKRNQTFEAAAVSALAKEAGITVLESQLAYVGVNRFVWNIRQEAPQQNGRVDVNFCYAYEPTAEELSTITAKLTSDEYNTSEALQRFDHQALKAAIQKENPAKQVLLDYYNTLFAS